jgi:hypothetical protein
VAVCVVQQGANLFFEKGTDNVFVLTGGKDSFVLDFTFSEAAR